MRQPPASAAGKRKRASSQSAGPLIHSKYSRRTLASRPGSIISSATPGPRPVISKSAYRAPVLRQQWTRDLPMIELSFIRTKATINSEGNVEFYVSDGVEAIEIAVDWERGQTRYEQGKPQEATGFIGKGYSKRGIYVSCHLHQAIKKGRFSNEHTIILGEIWWDRVCRNPTHG